MPSYVGICGSEKADTAAKSAQSLSTIWKFQLLALFPVLWSWSLKTGPQSWTVARETSYKLSDLLSVASDSSHPCLIRMKWPNHQQTSHCHTRLTYSYSVSRLQAWRSIELGFVVVVVVLLWLFSNIRIFTPSNIRMLLFFSQTVLLD